LHGIERTGIRPSLRFTPNEDLTVDLVYNYEKITTQAQPLKVVVLRQQAVIPVLIAL